MSRPDPLGTLLVAVFLFGVPVYLALGLPLCFWQARRRARQGHFTRRWAWGVSATFVAGPTLFLGLLITYAWATNPAPVQLTVLLCGLPLVPVLVWAVHWWLRLVGGWG